MTMSRRRQSDAKNVVPIDRGRHGPDPRRMTEFAETARRLQRERIAAEEIAQQLGETPHEEWPRLAEQQELHTSGVLDRLSSEVAALLEREPQAALSAANLASAIAEVLSVDAYPPVLLAQMRALAWKDRAQALSYIGRHDEALDSIDRAERLLVAFGSLAHDRAVARLVKAIVLQHLQRFDESLSLLAMCRSVFLDHGDSKRQLYCGIAEGILLYRRGALDRARDVFVPLLEVARSSGDMESLARLHNNIGHCSIELGETMIAHRHFDEAMRNLRGLGREAEAIRVEAAFGRVLVSRREFRSGIARLAASRSQFLAHGMVEEATLCGVEIVSALMESQRVEEARCLSAELADDRLGVGALQALRYLDQEIQAHDASLAVVRHVRDYLESLRDDPAREFVAWD